MDASGPEEYELVATGKVGRQGWQPASGQPTTHACSYQTSQLRRISARQERQMRTLPSSMSCIVRAACDAVDVWKAMGTVRCCSAASAKLLLV